MVYKENPSISIIVPAYNEEQRLPESIAKIDTYFASISSPYEIIIVNDGSTDSTAKLATEIASLHSYVRVIHLKKNRGKGYAVRIGTQEAKGQYILFSDADLSTPIFEVEKLLLYLGKGYDIAIGSRKMPHSCIEVRQPWYRELMGNLLSIIVHLLVVPGFSDTQCGFKCLTQKSAKKIFREQKIDGFIFDVEVLYLAHKYGFSVKEVPVIWRDSPKTSVKLIRDSIKMLLGLLKIRYNDLKGIYSEAPETSKGQTKGKH